MEFYRISCKAAAVGGVLEITCPENDCIIYRNLFRQYVDLRCDYYTGEDVLSETTKQLMTLHSRALGLELEKMFRFNEAVRSFRQGHLSEDVEVRKRTGNQYIRAGRTHSAVLSCGRCDKKRIGQARAVCRQNGTSFRAGETDSF